MKAMLVLIAGMLTACQSWQERGPDHRPPPPHRGVGASAGSSGATGSGTASGAGEGTQGPGKTDWYGTCDIQKQIANAPTPDERQALIDKFMPGMPQEAREQHLQMMQERCR